VAVPDLQRAAWPAEIRHQHKQKRPVMKTGRFLFHYLYDGS